MAGRGVGGGGGGWGGVVENSEIKLTSCVSFAADLLSLMSSLIDVRGTFVTAIQIFSDFDVG